MLLYDVGLGKGTRMARPKNGPRLTRERILHTALKLVDRDGLDALSMRKLASELEVDPMSIYHHIPNKDTLLRGLVEAVFAEVPEPPTRGDWRRRVRAWADAYRSVAAAHPNLVLRIVSDPATVAVAAVKVNESLYTALAAAQLPPRAVVGAADVIVDFVNGYCLAFAAPLRENLDPHEAVRAELEARPPQTTKTQRDLYTDRSIEQRDSFTFGLDVILGGIEQLLHSEQRS